MTSNKYLRHIGICMFPDRFMVQVKPNASKNEVLGQDDRGYRIAVRAPAQDGKANRELLRFLKRLTGKTARILSGETSKRKLVALDH